MKKIYIWELQVVRNSKWHLGSKLEKRNKIWLCRLLSSEFSASGDEAVPLPPGAGRAPFTGRFTPWSQGRTEEGQRVPPAPAVSPVTLTQGNHWAKVSHPGAGSPWPLHALVLYVLI